jgi:hypothetical protein
MRVRWNFESDFRARCEVARCRKRLLRHRRLDSVSDETRRSIMQVEQIPETRGE